MNEQIKHNTQNAARETESIFKWAYCWTKHGGYIKRNLQSRKEGGRLNLRTIKQEKGCEETNGDTVMKALEVATFAPSYYWTSK